jgi:Cyclin
MLDRLIAHNDKIPLMPNSLTRFHSRAAPSISVRDYLARICRFVNLEPCCLLILLYYVDKVKEQPGSPVGRIPERAERAH